MTQTAYQREWYQLNKERILAERREYYVANRERILSIRAGERESGVAREKKWHSRGLELSFEEFSHRAEDGCAECGAPVADKSGRSLHADHDHQTGQFRDVLCTSHNLRRR